MVLAKDQGVQEFHTDGASWRRVQTAEKANGNEILISANCALTDFTATNGATRVVPGSHKGGLLPHENPDWEYLNLFYVGAVGVGRREDGLFRFGSVAQVRLEHNYRGPISTKADEL